MQNTGGGRGRVSTASGGKIGTGGGRTQVITVIGGKRETGGWEKRGSKQSTRRLMQNTRGGRAGVSTVISAYMITIPIASSICHDKQQKSISNTVQSASQHHFTSL
jgi:hypothetical protein